MDELVLNYKIAGDGPPLLLIHGFGISFNIWKELVPLLCPYFTLVMVQLPGIGESPMPAPGKDYLCATVEALDSLRRDLGFDEWDILGYSTGSRIAEAYVRAHADHVCQAVFLCPLKIEKYKVLLAQLCFAFDKIIPGLIPWTLRGARLKFLVLLLGFSLRPDPHVREWQNEISKACVDALKETAKMVIQVGTRPFSVPVPFILIWGDTDMVTAKPFRPGERDHFINANHAAPILEAREMSDILINFLRKFATT